ncbi:glycosyl transferases group 1 family protein [Listeria floridensis FSL S10-1187]|uniref:Glycosyl transferases group 1 family protein n=2 Tax=Listeria floridensis TaxID=1494962 RepID=A0ABP3AX45_9LIST|nr:glycosyl transferases group 1 family protein [Listeria floridensis FSL S10-1187]
MCSSVHVWSDTRIYFKEAKSLAEKGFQVDFYAQDHPGEKEETPNLTMHYLPVLGRKERSAHRKTLYDAFMKSDAYFLHFHDPELLFLAKEVKKNLGNDVKIIYDMHEHLPAAILTKPWIPKPFRKLISSVVTRVERSLMKNYVDGVAFAEKSYRLNYEMLTMKKVDVLNYPVMPPALQVEKDEEFTLVYVGILTEQRGLYNMLGLASKLLERGMSDFKLKLIGPTFTDEEKLSAYIREHGLENNLIQYGRMQYKDIWEHYYKAHAGLCLLHPTPNNLNSHSTKLFEYMAAKLPIIASNFPDFTQMLTEEDCGLTADPFDMDRLADIAEYYKENPEKALQMGKNGYNAFSKKYSWDHEADELVKLYTELGAKK